MPDHPYFSPSVMDGLLERFKLPPDDTNEIAISFITACWTRMKRISASSKVLI